MTDRIIVLVTGIGGDLGQAIVKALRLSKRNFVCYGCDIEGPSVGSAFVEHFYLVPRADDSQYIEVLDQLCSSLGVQAVIPGSDPEYYVLCRSGNPPILPSGIPIVCQNADWMYTYGDKLVCLESLSNAIELVPFADGKDMQAVERIVQEHGFPLVVKERRSSGGRNMKIAYDSRELDTYLKQSTLPLVQAFIDDKEGEFSVGIFSTEDFMQGITFKRTLGPGGCSWFAETSGDMDVLGYALKVATKSQARGSINIQVRKSTDGVRLLEINPRFSSLAAARAVCGFNDVEWSLELTLGCLSLKNPQPIREICFYRFVSELVDFGAGLGRIPKWDSRSAVDT